MKKTVSVIIALLLTVTTAAAIVLDGLADDRSYRSNGSVQGAATEASLYTGTQAAGVDVGFVTHFLIPTLDGASISDAELSLTVTGNALTDTNTLIYLEIYGARSTSAGTGPVSADYTNATAKLVPNWLQLNAGTASGTYTASSSELTAWLAAQAGTNGNVYVFLTVKPTAAPNGTYKYLTVASGDAAVNKPQLTISTTTNAAPALTSYFTATPDSGLVPLTVRFNDASAGDITNRYWDFGDGVNTNTTLTSLDHIYVSTGTYTVALTVSGPPGSNTSTQTGLITVRAPVAPSASFSANPASGWTPLAVFFTDSSTGDITNRYWDFGDGSTTNTLATSVQHTYTSTGTYTVALTAEGPSGSDTSTQTGLIVATSFPENMRQAFSETSDAAIGLNTNLQPAVLWDGLTTMPVGDDAYSSGMGDCAAILVFQLPDPGGRQIADANLSVHWEGDFLASAGTGHPDSTDTTMPKWVSLYGIRHDTSNTVSTTDYGYKTTVGAGDVLIQEQLLYSDVNAAMDPTEEETDAYGDAALAAWLQAQYAAGAAAGDYVFLRVHARFDSGNAFKIYSGNSTTKPVLTLTLGEGTPGIPPPASTVSLSAYGPGQDVISWTTAQGSGYTYSVWVSTNLLAGFEPLKTNLADTVQSITNTIEAPAVFYKITAE